jgi:hypothetical protein
MAVILSLAVRANRFVVLRDDKGARPESSYECSLEAGPLMDLFMGAIHGFDSTPGEKSASLTRECFPRFVAHAPPCEQRPILGPANTPFTAFPAA